MKTEMMLIWGLGHIAWHLAGGMGWMILERPDDFLDNMDVSDAMAQTCDGWHAWGADNVVGELSFFPTSFPYH